MTKREVIGFIAARYGLVIDEDDPIFAVVAVQIALMEDYEKRLQKIEQDLKRESPTEILNARFSEQAATIRSIVANGVNWSSDPQTRWTWVFASLFLAVVLFGLGFVVGVLR